MANRRMFAKSIIDTDYFLEMPATSQLLYFHLSIRADDDGFVASPKRILRMVGSSEDDLKMLIAKQFVIPFDSGVCVIKHWRIHNLIRADRYQGTIYTQEKSMLIESENKSYELVHQNVIPDVIPTVNPVKVRLGKDSIGKDSICKDSVQMYDKCTPEKEYFENGELNQIFLDFIADRKKRGKKMTDKAIELTVKKLKRFRSDASRIKAITESIANGWIGIFEPAEDSVKKKYDRTANANFDGLKSGEVDF